MHKIIFTLLICCLVVDYSIAQSEISGPSFQEVISLRSVSSPNISPDGRHIVFTKNTVDWTENRYDTEIWLSKDGSDPFQITFTKEGSSTNPQWSHDGRWISFLATRGEKRQVHALDIRGGEARVLTDASEGINQYAWSPVDYSIAYTSSAPEDSLKKSREDELGSFSIEDAEFSNAQLWVVKVEMDLLTEAEVYCLDDKEKCPSLPEPRELIASDSLSVNSFRWSPDGTRISVEHQRDSNILSFMTSNISILDVETGELSPLISTQGYDGNAIWSPDGEWIAYSTDDGNVTSNFYRNSNYKIVNVENGESRSFAQNFDENLGLIDWTEESLYAGAWQKTTRVLFKIDPFNNSIEPVSDLPRYVWGIDISKDGSAMAIHAQTPETLSEVYKSSTQDMQLSPVTEMTKQIEGWELGTSEVVSWTSEDGAEIEGVLFKPADFDPDQKYPLMVTIHGGPTGIDFPVPLDNYVYPIPQWLAKGAVVLQPNYRGSAGYGESFRSLNVRNLGVGDAWDVLSGVDYLIDQGFVDENRMGAMGWSQGGYISAFLTTHTDRFKAISVGAGISNWVTYYVNTDIHPFTRQYLEATPWDDMEVYEKTSPMTKIKEASTPTLIQHGEFDRRVPIPNAYELFQGLQDQGVDTELIVYKGFGHGINKPKERLAANIHNWRWFARYVWGEDISLDSHSK